MSQPNAVGPVLWPTGLRCESLGNPLGIDARQPPETGHAEAGCGDHGRPQARWYDPHTGDLYETMAMVGCLQSVEAIARVLGEAEDAERYHSVQARLVAKCNRPDLLDRDTGVYGGGDQGCHALALALDIVPEELRTKVATWLIRDIMEARGGHLNTGFAGTVYLLKTLTRLRRPDVARRLLTHATPPSPWAMLRHPQTPNG